MPFVTSDVLRIAYTETGPAGGDPVLLLHGWPDCPSGWAAVAAGLAASGLRVIMPANRGTGGTTFRSADTVRDGQAAALVQDALDLAAALGLERFAVVGHDWGARVAYTLAAVAPDRLSSITALALAYQPHGRFTMPDFSQAQAFWYQWLMYVDAGAAAVAADPAGFARRMWQTWSPAGWWSETDFARAAADFANPDWAAITLNAYRARFLATEPRDPRYDGLRSRVGSVGHLSVPTLMIQGGSDFCDEPATSAGLDGWFDHYRRIVLDGVGHFPHREAPDAVVAAVLDHFSRF